MVPNSLFHEHLSTNTLAFKLSYSSTQTISWREIQKMVSPHKVTTKAAKSMSKRLIILKFHSISKITMHLLYIHKQNSLNLHRRGAYFIII